MYVCVQRGIRDRDAERLSGIAKLSESTFGIGVINSFTVGLVVEMTFHGCPYLYTIVLCLGFVQFLGGSSSSVLSIIILLFGRFEMAIGV